MAKARHYVFDQQFDIEQVLYEAQHRWLRPPEICEILRNYKKFYIAPEPPNMPPSGSLFLFDRKVLRYFRKDGYNWRKKKDGKTIREAHERLKADSVDVLHCYYAHGEENENFQRRSYWMLDENLSNIVLVHYREVKGCRTNFNRFKEAEEAIPNGPEIEQNVCTPTTTTTTTTYPVESYQRVCNPEVENSMDSSLEPNGYQLLSQNTGSKSLNSANASDYEDAESDSSLGKSSTAPSLDGNDDKSLQKHKKHLDLWGWEDALESHNARVQSESVKLSTSSMEPDSLGIIAKQGNELVKQLFTNAFYECQTFKSHVQFPQVWQVSAEDEMHLGSACKLRDTKLGKLHYPRTDGTCLDGMQPFRAVCKEEKSDAVSNLTCEKRSGPLSAARCQLNGSSKGESLKKIDSFSRWMSKELGDVEPVVQSCSDAYWDAVDNRSDFPSVSSQADLDSCKLSPSLSSDQLFRVIDFSPNWGYAGSGTKVLIAGKFLKAQEAKGMCQWSCMFGEMEVPAEVIADGVLRCHTPLHSVGRVPFYVTCSNRLACSEVREFEFCEKFILSMDATPLGHRCEALQIRFGRLLSLDSECHRDSRPCSLGDSSHLCSEITSSHKGNNDEWFRILKLISKENYSLGEVKERLVERLLKEKLCEWLLSREPKDGNSPCVLDEDGQGVMHFAAALGYDWAISLAEAAGVSVNFRDVHGWTALHWAASYGRERTVVYLISLGASAGALTDPTTVHPTGRTAADLASENGHKGIAGYLAESALSAHLVSLTLRNKNKEGNATEPSEMTPVLTASERIAVPIGNGDHLDGLALKDSLAAVCNATQAAARIHQVYRMQSFRRKQMRDCVEKIASCDEYAHSVVTMKSHKQVQHNDPVHAAAVRIQNKFRCWKGRKEFLTIRQQIVKIQAHIRGHQARKHYKKFVWSVGILEKVILRWRRKRSGLRGFKPESSTMELSSAGTTSMKDDYDFLKEGRKQAEERLQKALSRVKSMVRHPEARDQYRRLLTAVTEIKEWKGGQSEAIDGSETAASMNDDLVDVDTLLNDDTSMPTDC